MISCLPRAAPLQPGSNDIDVLITQVRELIVSNSIVPTEEELSEK